MSVNPRDRVNSSNGLDGFEDYTRQGTRKYGDGWQKIVVPVLIICAVVSMLVTADYWMNYGKIYRGVSAGSVPLGGKTPEEARKILEERVGGLKEIELTGPQEFTLTTDEMGVNYDVRAFVDQAYAVGRRGSILERLGDRVEAAWGTVRIPPVADYDRERLRNALSDVFAALTVKPVEAGFKVKDGGVYVTESRTGKSVEEEKLLGEIEAGLFVGKHEYEVPIVTEEPKLTTEEAERLKPTT
ncbi:MAG: peptidoglycan binding domain-containing protein, partial [Pseudomonadota bacterium]|nr:peptidoglycan binding domain-containing protein [Pseudomonadota bacterium]